VHWRNALQPSRLEHPFSLISVQMCAHNTFKCWQCSARVQMPFPKAAGAEREERRRVGSARIAELGPCVGPDQRSSPVPCGKLRYLRPVQPEPHSQRNPTEVQARHQLHLVPSLPSQPLPPVPVPVAVLAEDEQEQWRVCLAAVSSRNQRGEVGHDVGHCRACDSLSRPAAASRSAGAPGLGCQPALGL
jgi:hypothetical protein